MTERQWSDRERELWNEYQMAAHAMQSGVAMMSNYRSTDMNPKHLRVGINSEMVSHGALVRLLIEKGLFTNEEYMESLVWMMREEVKRYEEMIKAYTGTEIHLA